MVRAVVVRRNPGECGTGDDILHGIEQPQATADFMINFARRPSPAPSRRVAIARAPMARDAVGLSVWKGVAKKGHGVRPRPFMHAFL